MKTYIMSMKSGWFANPKLRDNSNIIFKTDAESLEDATAYFIKLKDLSEKEFHKLFIVTPTVNDDKI